MKIQQDVLIDKLKNDVEVLLKCVESFKEEKDALLIPPIPGRWSITQIIEHLNIFGRIYLPAIDQAICTSSSAREAWFNSGGLGNAMANFHTPSNVFDIKNKVKTLKPFEPGNNLKPDKVFDEFVEQQHKLMKLMDMARTRSLNATYVPLSVAKLIKIKLGDTLRYLVGHEQRHFIQARNALHFIGLPTNKFPVILQATPQ